MSTTDSSQLSGSELTAALTAARIGSWTLDLATGILECSSACKANFGRGPSESFTYEELAAAVVDEDRARWRADVAHSIATASDFELEYRARWPDGSVHWVLVRGSCRVDDAGRPTRMVGVSVDVTARKLGEQALDRAERRQRFLSILNDALRPIDDPRAIEAAATTVLGKHVGAGRVAYFEIDGSDYLVNFNYVHRLRQLTGRFPTSAHGGRLFAEYQLGRPVRSSDVAADARLVAEEREAYLALDIRSYLGVPVIKAGTVVGGLVIQSSEPRQWSDDDLALAEETAERTWAAVERARAIKALNESRARFELVLKAAEVGFWFCDLPFEVLVWDERVKEHFWLAADAHVTIDTFYDRLHPDDRERIRRAVAQSIDDRAPYDVAYRTLSSTGEQKWIRAIGRTYYAESGEPTRFDGVTLDITAQRQAEDTLRENDRRKDEFLAMLAHELRNPLAPIINASHLLNRPETGPALHQRAVEIIDRQVQHLTKLVDDLLDVSRITQQKITLRREPLEIDAVLDRAIEANKPLLEARRQHLHVSTSDPAIRVSGDMTRLVQVVSNLLNNAAKYTDEGGHISLAVSGEGGDAVVRVTDDGIGIATELLPTVFDLFMQADRSLDRAQGGLGLGLTLVRLLVEMHGGRVEASSRGHGRGSEFVVRLPRVELTELPEIAPGARADVEIVQRSLRILLVEDHRDSARKLPRQADTPIGDSATVCGLGRNVRGGTRPRLSCGRSSL